MIKVSWQDHFKSSLQNAESLYAQDAPDISFLLFCLRENLIPPREYLSWAIENYQIPLLSDRYFQEHKAPTEIYTRWLAIHDWSGECLPVAEWNGILYVACLEIPQHYSSVNPTVFVLASPECLWNYWRAYQEEGSGTVVDNEVVAAIEEKSAPSPDILNAALTDMSALEAVIPSDNPNAGFIGANGEILLQSGEDEEEASSRKSEDEEESKPSESHEEEADGMPVGLFDEAAPAAPLKLSDNGDVALAEAALKKSPLEGMQPVKLTGAPPPPPPMENTVPPNTPMPTEQVATATMEVSLEAPKKGPRSVEPVVVNENSSPNVPQAPVKPSMAPGSTAAYFLEKLRNQNKATFDQEITASLQQLKTFFKKSMVLAVGDKDSFVKPLIWDKEFENRRPQAVEFNIKTPSIFRVVSGTQKPYHGYVIVNDLNESFFEAWNQGQVPDHVTIVPLIDGDRVVGMLMGIGEKSSYNKNVLSFTENIAKNLSKKILTKPASDKAA